MVDYFNKSKFDLMCVLDADNQYSSKDINILIDEMRERIRYDCRLKKNSRK